MGGRLVDGTDRFAVGQDVLDLADSIVAAHHPELLGRRIDYVFLRKTPKSKGRITLGRAKIVSGLTSYLAGEGDDEFGVVELASFEWAALTEGQRRALLDHELCHFGIEEDDDGVERLKLVGHDVEEFHAILKRHGLWRSSLIVFADEAIGQLSLLPDEDRQRALREEAAANVVEGMPSGHPDSSWEADVKRKVAKAVKGGLRVVHAASPDGEVDSVDLEAAVTEPGLVPPDE